MHARRRRALGLAAFSLAGAGAVVLGQPGHAPGTERAASSAIRPKSITLRHIAPRQVFTYRAGRRLAAQLPPLRARISDTYTKGETDQRFLARADALAAFLPRGEAESTYAKKSEAIAGQGQVLTSALALPSGSSSVKLFDVPGFSGFLSAEPGGGQDVFRFHGVGGSGAPPPVEITDSRGGGATISSGNPVYEVRIAPGTAVTLQLILPGATTTDADVATITLSSSVGGSPRQFVAQGLVANR